MYWVYLLVLVAAPFSFACAYLDPGSGSFIIQLVVGAVLGSLVAIKMYFKNIKKSILKIFSKNPSDETKFDEKNQQE